MLRQRRLVEEGGPRRARGGRVATAASRRADDEPIDVKAFLVEPDAAAKAHLLLRVAVGRRLALEPLDVDADCAQQTHRLRAVLEGPLDIERAAVQQQQASV